MRVVCGYLNAKFKFMLITYQMESLEELLESITSTLQSQYSSRFIRVSNPMALNATPEVLKLNIYAICSLWLSDALSENALDGGPVGDTRCFWKHLFLALQLTVLSALVLTDPGG